MSLENKPIRNKGTGLMEITGGLALFLIYFKSILSINQSISIVFLIIAAAFTLDGFYLMLIKKYSSVQKIYKKQFFICIAILIVLTAYFFYMKKLGF